MANTTHCGVGSVRPSQLLWTYGPGALIDLPNLSVLMMGTDFWKEDNCQPIEEQRLLMAVRRRLGEQVKHLRMPPVQREEILNPLSAEAFVGAPVQPFPRWLRCVKCGLLAEYDSGLFEIKESPFRPEQTRFIHKGCPHGQKVDAVPARFLLACAHGHLDDFPWRWFVHGGLSDCRGTLHFFESGASLQTENLWVKCDGCGMTRQLAHAFGPEAAEFLPGCRGRHPHMDTFEECHERPRTIILGSTNGWFPVTMSVLALPTERDGLAQLVADGWEYFKDLEDESELKVVLKTLKKMGTFTAAANWEVNVIWAAIGKKRNQQGGMPDPAEKTDLKLPEWEVLTNPNPPTDWPHFLSHREPAPKAFEHQIQEVLLLDRLRKVNALTGFTRIESLEEDGVEDEGADVAPLSKRPPTWVPACEVHGEGIFIRFKENILQEWESRPEVVAHDLDLQAGYRGWRNARRRDPSVGYPGMRYVLLHTIAHLLIRELALECGYNGSSIQERIYARNDPAMAGILLYTASSDSDGTLGGLVELGNPETLERLLRLALERAQICSSDPLCSKHNPKVDRSTHAAACHACSFVSETSCEAGNKFLDRALVVKTCDRSDVAFFADL